MAPFIAELFQGNLRWDLLHPFPEQDPADKRIGDEYILRLKRVLEGYIDPEEVDRTGDVPQEALLALAELGCFGLRIPRRYGGLGMSQTNYSRIMGYVWSFCSSTATWLMAHQSGGLPVPLLEFGTEEQREAYLPRIARGSVTALAFTEPDAGSDPLHTRSTAVPSEDGQGFVIHGEKLWCTNGPSAELVLVIAATPHLSDGDRGAPELSAFIVESDAAGLEISHYCSFLGNRGISSGVLRFSGVTVPLDAMLGRPGDGLHVVEAALTASRLALPATSAAVGKVCAHFAKTWCNERDQGGATIGKHLAVAEKVSHILLDTFAMDSLNAALCAMADRAKGNLWVEAAVAKYFSSETAWRTADQFVQVRGGRGLETAESLARRGEDPVPAERMLRDARMNRIREGTTEIIRARVMQAMIAAYAEPRDEPRSGRSRRRRLGLQALWQCLWRLPTQWIPELRSVDGVRHLYSRNRGHLRFATSAARRLSGALADAIARDPARLEREHILVRALVDIAAELFAMTATLARAERLLDRRCCPAKSLQTLVDTYCSAARERIEGAFRALSRREARSVGRISSAFLNGDFDWLAEGVYTDFPPQFVSAAGLRHVEGGYSAARPTPEEAEEALLEEMAAEEEQIILEAQGRQSEKGADEEAGGEATEPGPEEEAAEEAAESSASTEEASLVASAAIVEEAQAAAEAEPEPEIDEAAPAEVSSEVEPAQTARG